MFILHAQDALKRAEFIPQISMKNTNKENLLFFYKSSLRFLTVLIYLSIKLNIT
jgi:hypothetical protein